MMTFHNNIVVQNSEQQPLVKEVDDATCNHEVESLKQQLEKEKQMNRKLLSNIKKIKKKMIDVSSLIELHDGLKRRIEEQNAELQKFYQQNQTLLLENANLKKTKSSSSALKSSDNSSEQIAQLQKLRLEKIELENLVKRLKENIEKVNSEKNELKKQLENEERKCKKQEATNQQVEELRAAFRLAQDELTKLRSQKGSVSYGDFAVVKNPTTISTTTTEKKICKSIAVNTEASLLEKYIALKYPSRAPPTVSVSTAVSRGKDVTSSIQNGGNDDDDEFEPLGSMDTSFDNFEPPKPSYQSNTPKPPPPNQSSQPSQLIQSIQPSQLLTSIISKGSTNSKRKNEETNKEQEKQFERKLKKMKKPSSSSEEFVVPSSKSVSTSPMIQSPSHIPIIEKRTNNKESTTLPIEKPKQLINQLLPPPPPPKITTKESTVPQLPLIYFEKLENQTVETYIENIFINFICKFEPFINETKYQSSLLGDVNRACKNIWKHYPNHTNEIAKGILTIFAKMIASRASCEKWGLCIILLDHMDIYSFSNQLLETIFSNLYLTITSFITTNTTTGGGSSGVVDNGEQSFKKLMALLAGISTISNAKFARFDFCMFSKVKELFYYILHYSLQNTRNQFGMIKYSNFQLLLAMITSNKRLLTNGFDTYSPLDITVNYMFWTIQSTLISTNSQQQQQLDAESAKAIGDIEKLRDLYSNNLQVQALTPNTLSQTIIESIVSSSTSKMAITQAFNSLSLLTVLLDDWNFTFNTIILNGLWPLVLQYLNNENHNNGTEQSKLVSVLSIITKLAIQRSQQIPLDYKANQNEWDCLEIYHDGLGDLLDKFMSILKLENVFSIESSKLIAEAMIEIVVNRLALSNLVPYQEKREYFIQSLKCNLDYAKDWLQKHQIDSDLFKIMFN